MKKTNLLIQKLIYQHISNELTKLWNCNWTRELHLQPIMKSPSSYYHHHHHQTH